MNVIKAVEVKLFSLQEFIYPATIELKDNVTLHLKKDARLLGSTDIEQYRNLDPFTEGLGIDVGWALIGGC